MIANIPAVCPANTSSPATTQEVLETDSESVVIALIRGYPGLNHNSSRRQTPRAIQ
jgi:hypothetical protein